MESFMPPAPLQVDDLSRTYLADAARWARFLAIAGFVVCGFVVLAGIFAGTIMSQFFAASNERVPVGGFMPMLLSVVYLVLALVYFFPCLYLYRFSTKVKQSLMADNQAELTEGFRNLKSAFKFVGILTIVVICVYLLSAVVGVMIAASRFGN